MTGDTIYDVLQIGYGPVSQVMALMLARRGFRVGVVERWLEPYALPRAVCVDHEAARILRAIGVGDGLDRVSRPAPRYQWFNAQWEELLSIDWSADSLSGGPEVNFVHQPSLEAEFRKLVAAEPRVELKLGWEYVGHHDRADHVEVEIARVGGSERLKLRTRFLVGADGANSAVREHLGIGREDRGFEADWLVVDMELKPGVVLDLPACGQYCDPERPTTIVPGGTHDGRICRRWEFMRLPGESRDQLEGEGNVWRLLSAWVNRNQADLVRHAIYTFRSLLADTWRHGRVLLVGDAAHTMPPFMGQGMCAGIRDAWNLSWKLGAILDGCAELNLLETYTSERKPHASAVIDASIYLGRLICIADPEAAARRDEAYRSGTAEPLPTFPHLTSGFLAPIGTRHGAIAGRLAPHATVRWRGRTGRWDDVVGFGFRLVLVESNSASLIEGCQLSELKRLGVATVGISAAADGDAVIDVDGKMLAFCQAHGIVGFIVRPDFYIFGAAVTAHDIAGLVDVFIEAARHGGLRDGGSGPMLGRRHTVRSAKMASPIGCLSR